MANDNTNPPGDDDLDDDAPYISYQQEEANRLQAEADEATAIEADVVQNARYDDFFAPYKLLCAKISPTYTRCCGSVG